MVQSFNEDMRIGDRIGRYEILSVLGSGSMGMVYKCRHDVLGRVVAIKTLRLRAATDDRTQKRFIREAQMTNRLNHSNLIGLIDFGNMENGDPFLVMEYVCGQSLYEVMKRERYLIPERAVHLFAQVCDGLFHAHERGVVHRDLKPANILVIPNENAPETVKIVDLGVAKIVHGGQEEEAEAITMTGEVCGSPIYLSPEQCMYQELDARTDIYSLGVCMYECLTGTPPLRGATVYDTIYMHVHDMPRPFAAVSANPDIPRKLEEIVFKCLAKSPDERYSSMMQVKNDLLNALKSGPETGINVLPPETFFPKPAGKVPAELPVPDSRKSSGADSISGSAQADSVPPQLSRKASQPFPIQKQQRVEEPITEDPEEQTNPKAVKRSTGGKASRSETKELPVGTELTKMVILLSVAFLLIGLGIGFAFAYFVNRESEQQRSAVIEAPLVSQNLRNSDKSQTASPGLAGGTPAASTNPPKKNGGKNTAAGKQGKNSANSKAPAKKLSLEDMERLADGNNGSQSKYFSIVKNNNAAPQMNPGMRMPGDMNSMPRGSSNQQILNNMKNRFGNIAKQLLASQTGGPQAAQQSPFGGMQGGQQNPFAAISGQQNPGMMPAQPLPGPNIPFDQNQFGGMPFNQGGGQIPFGAQQQPQVQFHPNQYGSQQQAPHHSGKSASEEALALHHAGVELGKQGKYAEACQKLEAAYKLCPSQEGVREMYGWALNSYAVQQNSNANYEQAVALAQKATNVVPEKAKYHENLLKFQRNVEGNRNAGK